MEITFKSLHHTNIVFVFDERKFVMPNNTALLSLYKGQKTGGANFADDVTLRTKVLDLPGLKMQVSVEPNRLRVDDNSQVELRDSNLIKEALNIYHELFSETPLTGFGFNFDIYYQFRDVLMIKEFFAHFMDSKILEKANLLDIGVQFTLEKEEGKRRETYFLKVTAPLEVAVHVNSHFFVSKILEPLDIQELFETCYEEIDDIAYNLKF